MKNRPSREKSAVTRLRGIACGLAAITIVISCVGCSAQMDTEAKSASDIPRDVTLTKAQRQNIHVYTVAPSTFHKTVDATGVVDFDNDHATSVLAPFSGPVSRLLVASGEHVNKGAVLAVVDSPDFATAVSVYKKALATANTARRLADMDKDLVQHDGVAQREEDQAKTDAGNSAADRDAARQALVALDVEPRTIKAIEQGRPTPRIEGMIRSPVAGTVVEKLITPGQLLQAGTTPCFTVADLSHVWVMAQVSAADLASVSVGDPVDVVTGIAGNDFSGTVDNIAALVNPDTRAVLVRVVVDNARGFLRKQMYVNVRIHSRKESHGALIPVSAILRDDENLPFVYVAQPDGGFARRHVTLGYRTGDQYDVPEGITAGDQVVVDGGIFVQFMQSQ
ncbi:MAG: efflux RND transporter periplasmic adaptor subunit [Dokdonella sp.]